jgi:Uma2 family endonuclease
MTAIAPPLLPTDQGRNEHRSGEQRLLLHNVSWRSYVTIGDALGECHVRLTFDRGNLEFMTLSPEHERYKNLLRCLIQALAEELNLPIGGLGSTTDRREDLDRGLEPDECWYIRHLPAVRGKKRLDLTVDPPPDLVVEIDITSSSLNRMEIYASLGVPEAWRFDGTTLQVYRLGADGHYQVSERSVNFPSVPVTELLNFVRQGEAEDDTSMLRAFRAWVREQLAKG